MANKTQKCSKCEEVKGIELFRKRKEVFGGGYYSICRKCIRGTKETKQMKQQINRLDPNTKIDLKEFLDLEGFTDQEIKLFAITVLTYRKAPYLMKYSDIYSKYFPGRGMGRCSGIMSELKEAAKHGYIGPDGLDKYLKDGRKYRRDGKLTLEDKKKR